MRGDAGRTLAHRTVAAATFPLSRREMRPAGRKAGMLIWVGANDRLSETPQALESRGDKRHR